MKSTRFLLLVACVSIAGCGPSAIQRSDSAHAASPDASAKVTEPADAKITQPTQPKGKSLDELLLFFPAKFPVGLWKPEGLHFEDAWWNAEDGTRLHGWYCPCDNPRAIVLYAHGNAGNLSHRASRLKQLQKDLRVTVLIFDYRGYGQSDGTPTAEGILQDARAARKFLAGRAKVHESQIVLLGDSLGGAVAVQLAADAVGTRGLILESTFSSLADVASHHYPKLAWLVPADKLNSVARIAKYKGPLLQGHGDADRTIPFTLGQKLFDAAPGPKQFVRIPGGDHNDPKSADYLMQLDRFIRELPNQ